VGIRPNTAAPDAAGWTANLPTNWVVGLIVAVLSLAMILWAVWQSKRESAEMKEIDVELAQGSSGKAIN